MVLAAVDGLCRSARALPRFRLLSPPHPPPPGIATLNRDERPSDQSATIPMFRDGSFRIVNHSFTSKWDCWTSKDN